MQLTPYYFIPNSAHTHTLHQFYPITSPVLFTENNKLWNERKDECLCIWLLERMTLYQRASKIAYLYTTAF